MTRRDLMEHWDSISLDPSITLSSARRHLQRVRTHGPALLEDRYVVVQSTGSTGTPLILPWLADDLILAAALGDEYEIDRRGRDGLGPNPRIAWVHASSPAHLGSNMTWLTGGTSAYARAFDPAGSLRDLVLALNDFQPHILNSYPSVLAQLAGEQLDGRLGIGPQIVGTYGETATASMRSIVELAFNRMPMDHYSASECPTIAVQMADSRDLVVLEDKAIVESVDLHGMPVPNGTPGSNTLLTNLVNTGFPLIRYVLEDRITVDVRDGRRFITAIHGRSADLFAYSDGVLVLPIDIAGTLDAEDVISDHQMRQTEEGMDVDIVALHPVNVGQLRQRLEAELLRTGLRRPAVHVRQVSSIPIEQAGQGKHRRYIPLRTAGVSVGGTEQ
jgi:phenylacetate-coenzyme A ligase PaaK-like adenylate-forming protein